MCTNCAPLIADLFLFCYERDFVASLSCNKEAGIIQVFVVVRHVRRIVHCGQLMVDLVQHKCHVTVAVFRLLDVGARMRAFCGTPEENSSTNKICRLWFL